MAKYKGTPEDLIEFGSDEETGGPCVGTLIRALPEHAREPFRQQKRAHVAKMCKALYLKPCTYREYLLDLTVKENLFVIYYCKFRAWLSSKIGTCE